MKMSKALLASCLFVAMPLMAADYDVDAAHTTVQFKVGHLGFSELVGRFNTFSGSYSMDDANPAAAKASLEVDAASVDTNHEARDKHLRSPDFLDVKQFPKMNFVSSSYQGTKDKGVLKGTLTLHGVSKEVAFDVVKIGEGKDPWGGYRSGFNASTTIKRSDFGVSYMLPGIPDEMSINLFVEGVRK
ncbi:MAG: YceI family protein [Aeromonas sp.]